MIAIPNMDKPKDCWECFNYDCGHWGTHGYDFAETDCSLIEVDESEMEYLYREFGLEEDEDLTDRAIELKHAILMGYIYAKREIVTCGECKWSYTDERDGLMWCKVHMSHYRVNADHFCSYGERRTDD